PKPDNGARGQRSFAGKNVRVPADEFLGDRLHYVAEIEDALFLRHSCVENDLKQKVAELLFEISKIAAGNSVGDFIGFFQRVGRDGGKILRQIPWAAGFGGAQRRHDVEKALNFTRRVHRWKILIQSSRSRYRSKAAGTPSELKNRRERHHAHFSLSSR